MAHHDFQREKAAQPIETGEKGGFCTERVRFYPKQEKKSEYGIDQDAVKHGNLHDKIKRVSMTIRKREIPFDGVRNQPVLHRPDQKMKRIFVLHCPFQLPGSRSSGSSPLGGSINHVLPFGKAICENRFHQRQRLRGKAGTYLILKGFLV